MLNCVYRLVAPRSFEPVQVQVPEQGLQVVVRPTHLSICNADMRYYLGTRGAEALAKKLPMALIHEGIGRVVLDTTGTFQPGQRVVMLPNNPHETDPVTAENYLRSSEFCGSGFDGFMQECVYLPASRVLALPDGIVDEVAAFTEIVSVGMHAVARFERIAHERRDCIGVWGDGNLGFIVALVLRLRYPDARLVVVGRNRGKLAEFTFADDAIVSYDLPSDLLVDHAFECCGGDGSTAAIDQIIDAIRPEGTVSLLGVSENAVPINTRMVLEKGLRLFGSSRSGRADFEATLAFYGEHPEALDYLSRLVGQVHRVETVAEMTKAFDSDTNKLMGKTIMEWNA